ELKPVGIKYGQSRLAHGAMGLRDLLVHHFIDGRIILKRSPGKLALLDGNVPQEMLHLFQYFSKTDISHHRKNNLMGVQPTAYKFKEILLCKAGNGLLRTQDIPA